jgi:nucleoside-diphosphate-sugar epimerase/predicted dehydrogenase
VEFFVDKNLPNANRAVKDYGGGKATIDYRDIIEKVDAAIIAVPNDLHSAVSVDFLAAGRHVLCEKPIANNVDNAKRMIEASMKSGARLSVNLFRRRYKCYRILKDLLNRSFIGKVNRIHYQEGIPTSWPFSSSYILRKERSGGGALIDWGAHPLDTLGWLFGDSWELKSYRDDGLGRIESNCVLDFVINSPEKPIPCHVELSYARRLGRKMAVETDWCKLSVDEFNATNSFQLVGGEDDLTIGEGATNRTESTVTIFADQVKSFVNCSQDASLAGAVEATRALKFIEECYEKREDLNYSWNKTDVSSLSASSHPGRILIVGASGFLGSRLAEVLSMGFGLNVRATYHRPVSAIKIARLPVELLECDVLDSTQVSQAMKGCDVVVNCAIGTSGDSDAAKQVYTQGTQNLLEAAQQHGVRKFIHISTAAVHNFRQGKSEINESCAYRSSLSRNSYEKGKIAQERIVRRFAKSVPTVILRPTIIYGPYSFPWVINVADRLKDGAPTLVEGDGIANLVYIDDVVDAILLAIEAEGANGSTMIVNNDKETVHWLDYVSKFADLTGTSPNLLPTGSLSIVRLRKSLSICRDSTSAFLEALTSREMIALLARIPLAVALGSRMAKGARRQGIEKSLSSAEPRQISDLRKRMSKYETMTREQHENLTCRSKFSSALAKGTCGWSSRTSFAEGLRKTIEYAEWAGLA